MSLIQAVTNWHSRTSRVKVIYKVITRVILVHFVIWTLASVNTKK